MIGLGGPENYSLAFIYCVLFVQFCLIFTIKDVFIIKTKKKKVFQISELFQLQVTANVSNFKL